jgi:hypothetical protein
MGAIICDDLGGMNRTGARVPRGGTVRSAQVPERLSACGGERGAIPITCPADGGACCHTKNPLMRIF